ncbi:hypothetical protein B1207_07860 [Legionella quinlivanii]|uniref:Uncharacterized protein n=1 Tax=Legionella quinlivanii TaxID=45073 RepID=A0A364LJN0_9GAMM|nr:hypothetical protein [Legionella quinlivanii]RAP36706.1 hypothetical protein B1207_07860 [Legionella quinlivanii]
MKPALHNDIQNAQYNASIQALVPEASSYSCILSSMRSASGSASSDSEVLDLLEIPTVPDTTETIESVSSTRFCAIL